MKKSSLGIFYQEAFTLFELLVVIVIGAILMFLSFGAYLRVFASSNLDAATQSLVGELEEAQEVAITRNVEVEARLYELPDYNVDPINSPPTAYRGMQIFLVTNTGYVPVSKPLYFPAPFIIQSVVRGSKDLTHSTLLDSSLEASLSAQSGTSLHQSLALYDQNYRAVCFCFLPKGGLNLDHTKQWFVTLLSEQDKLVANNLPANFATIQIDPLTGRTRSFRP